MARVLHLCSAPAVSSGASVDSADAPVPRTSGFTCFLCNTRLPVEVRCSLCTAIVCLAHRDPTHHSCSSCRIAPPSGSGKAAAVSGVILPLSRSLAGGGGGGGAAGGCGAGLAAASSIPSTDGSAAEAARATAPSLSSSSCLLDPARRAQSDALRRKVALMALKSRCTAPRGVASNLLRYFEVASCVPAAGLVAGSRRAHIAMSCHMSGAHLLDAAALAHSLSNPNAREAEPGKRLHLWSAGALYGVRENSAAAYLLLPLDASLDCLEREGLLRSGDTVMLTLGCSPPFSSPPGA